MKPLTAENRKVGSVKPPTKEERLASPRRRSIQSADLTLTPAALSETPSLFCPSRLVLRPFDEVEQLRVLGLQQLVVRRVLAPDDVRELRLVLLHLPLEAAFEAGNFGRKHSLTGAPVVVELRVEGADEDLTERERGGEMSVEGA